MPREESLQLAKDQKINNIINMLFALMPIGLVEFAKSKSSDIINNAPFIISKANLDAGISVAMAVALLLEVACTAQLFRSVSVQNTLKNNENLCIAGNYIDMSDFLKGWPFYFGNSLVRNRRLGE